MAVSRSKILATLALALSLSGAARALPVQIEQGETLKVTSRGETLFEVDAVAKEALEKLTRWLESPPGKVSASVEGGVIKGLPVELVVTPDIAKRWKSEQQALAKLFTERLNSALGESKPQWTVSGQVVPLSETRTVNIKPFPAGAGISVSSTDPEVLSVEDLGDGNYRLTGRKWGRASLVASASTDLSLPELPVSVKPWAARWGDGPEALTLWGTATNARVERSVRRWLSARTLNSASVELSPAGEGYSYKAVASAPGAITVEKTFPLKVMEYDRQPVRPAETVVLSNHPERIVSDGVLFDRRVDKTPFRFMWHHRNDPAGSDRYLLLQLTNPTASKRRIRYLWYGYGPSPDEIHVGHTAALDYSVAGAQGLGEELVLPPNGSRTIEIRRVKPGQTMSGMAYFDDLEGTGPLDVSVMATSGMEFPQGEAAERDNGRTASGIFPAEIETEATHVLGGPFTYLEYGGEPYEKDVDKGHPSYGNFGTVYRTRLMLKNPTADPKEAVIGFASGGGAARGVLALDGELYDLPMGTSGTGIPVKTYTLEPGQVRQVDVELMPQAGSNYPVRVVVRSEFERLEKEDIPPLRPLRPTIP